MRAYVIEENGGPEKFKQAELPDPTPGPGEVRIKVAASSFNPIDAKIRDGLAPIGPAFPAVLAGDVAGTIDLVGDGVEGFAVGDEVYGCSGGIKGRNGALAEWTVAQAAVLSKKPASLSMAEAAALPLVGITAWYELVQRARLQPGQHVLVHGGTGGVGHVAVQLAKALGATVTTTCGSDAKCEIARGLGADNVFNYKTTSVADIVAKVADGRGFEIVVDNVGGPVLDQSFEAAAPGGTVVTINARNTHDLTPAHGKALSLHVVMMLVPALTGQNLEQYGEILGKLTKLVEAGKIKPLLDEKSFHFADIAEAHRYAESGQVTGKVSLTP